jgi:hypothetical protein
MASAIPTQAETIHDLAVEHEWAVKVTEEQMPIKLGYDDGSNRTVDTDTYQLVGSKGKAVFMVGWYVNPHTDHWNVSIRHAALITANEMEMRIADALDVLPRYVYWDHMNYRHFKDWLAAENPEGILINWSEKYDIKEEDGQETEAGR